MSYPPKVNTALALLENTGIWRSNYAPLLHRLFWRAGITIPPPHFASFKFNFIFLGVWFGVVCGLMMWFMFWSNHDKSSSESAAIIGTSLAGVLYGMFMALYYRIGARKHGLPSWSSIKAAS